MSLLRFDTPDSRGPTAALWGGLVDWTKGVLSLNDRSGHIEDYAPFMSDLDTVPAVIGTTSTGDGAVIQTDEPHGVVNYDEASGTDEMVGFLVKQYVDLDRTGFKEFCMEARLKSNDDSSTTQTFVGLSDVSIDSFFGTDNTPDGSSIGVRWNGDETLDLVSIASDDTITVLSDAFATVERTVGFVKIGVRIKSLDGTNYRVTGTITSGTGADAVTVETAATTSTIPGAAMLPVVLHTNDNQAAPDMEVDWYAYIDRI